MNEELLIALLHCLLEAKPEGFKCDVFEIDPFDHYDEDKEDAGEVYNTGECFYCFTNDIGISWYKHPGRGMTGNYQDLTAKEILQMGLKCFEAMGK